MHSPRLIGTGLLLLAAILPGPSLQGQERPARGKRLDREQLAALVRVIATKDKESSPNLISLCLLGKEARSFIGRVEAKDWSFLSWLAVFELSLRETTNEHWDCILEAKAGRTDFTQKKASLPVSADHQAPTDLRPERIKKTWSSRRIRLAIGGLADPDAVKATAAARELLIAYQLGLFDKRIPARRGAHGNLWPSLLAGLRSKHDPLRYYSLLLLSSLPYPIASIEMKVGEALRSSNPRIHSAALLAAPSFITLRQSARDSAFRALKMEDALLRRSALLALARFGGDLSAAQGDLITPVAFEALRSLDADLLLSAIRLLSRVPYDRSNPSPAAWESRVLALIDVASLETLGYLPACIEHRLPDSPIALKLLCSVLDAGGKPVHPDALDCLRYLPLKRSQLVTLTTLLDSPEHQVREMTFRRIASLNGGILQERFQNDAIALLSSDESEDVPSPFIFFSFDKHEEPYELLLRLSILPPKLYDDVKGIHGGASTTGAWVVLTQARDLEPEQLQAIMENPIDEDVNSAGSRESYVDQALAIVEAEDANQVVQPPYDRLATILGRQVAHSPFTVSQRGRLGEILIQGLLRAPQPDIRIRRAEPAWKTHKKQLEAKLAECTNLAKRKAPGWRRQETHAKQLRRILTTFSR